jgi:hypothetical protein
MNNAQLEVTKPKKKKLKGKFKERAKPRYLADKDK